MMAFVRLGEVMMSTLLMIEGVVNCFLTKAKGVDEHYKQYTKISGSMRLFVYV